MSFCCYPDPPPAHSNVYVNNYQTIQIKESTQKPKFSFRNSSTSSRVLDNPQKDSQLSIGSQRYDYEIEQLEREYEILREEEKVATDF